jgi:PIN domain nuclease of toxin-antitoxin system
MQNGNGSPLSPLLIDTHYWIWLEAGDSERLSPHNRDVIQEAASSGNLFISVMSVWELGMLDSKGRIQLRTNCTQWVADALAQPGVTLAPLTPAIALESSNLPGTFHGDPADRIIVATARALKARLLTSDKNIRAYARQRRILLA